MYQLREILFDKLNSFGVPYTDNQKLFSNLTIFDFESICVEHQSCRDTKTTTRIGKHIPISVSITSNLIQNPIFLSDPNPRELVSSFVNALENLATQSKTPLKINFLQVETAIKSTLAHVETQNQRRSHSFGTEAEDDNSSAQFLQMQKNQLIDLKKHFRRYCNTLPVFGFNSATYNINLIKSYLRPILVNEGDVEPIVIKKANQFVSFKFGNVQHLDILNFVGYSTNLGSFVKFYKESDTRGYLPYEWFNHPNKLNVKELPPYEAFHNKL